MKAAIAGVRGESYNVAQSYFMPGWPGVYPTSGASDDWVYSRHYANPADPLILAYTIEFNRIWGQFDPTWTEMGKIILDVDAGLVRFCADAATPTPWRLWVPIFDLCWWRTKFWAIWKRVFPPDLWGPYGPWGRIWAAIQAVINPVLELVASLIRRVRGRR
jgi:hypothetical protein